MPVWDSKQGRDGQGKKFKWRLVSSSRQAGSNNSHLLPHLMQLKCSNGGEALHFKLFVQYLKIFDASGGSVIEDCIGVKPSEQLQINRIVFISKT